MTLNEAILLLEEAGIESAAYDARLIFETVGGIPRTRLVTKDFVADERTLAALKRRALREPLQYIIGEVNFFREIYTVSPDCLIPRPDTELLVELAVKLLPKGARFLDLCTGSGCIAVSIVRNTKETQATALDISEKAIGIAKKNAERNGVSDRIEFTVADALSEAVKGDYYAVISNPPYITEKAYASLEPELAHEPKIALVGGGKDGADFYRRITSLYADRIPKNGFILFEIGFDQGDALKSIAVLNSMSIEIFKDYSGLDRIALLKPL